MNIQEELTDLQHLFLKILQDSSDWMTRSDIAVAIERPHRLNPHDVAMLDDLASKNMIDIDERKVGAVKTVYIYKTKQSSISK